VAWPTAAEDWPGWQSWQLFWPVCVCVLPAAQRLQLVSPCLSWYRPWAQSAQVFSTSVNVPGLQLVFNLKQLDAASPEAPLLESGVTVGQTLHLARPVTSL